MRNRTFPKAIIIILAVVSIGLAALYAHITINGPISGSDLSPDGIADYGSDSLENSSSTGGSGVTVVSGSDGSYTITDDGTVEMDSIPNDIDVPSDSDSDAE